MAAGHKIRELRTHADISLRRLAHLAHVSPTYLCKIEREHPAARPTTAVLRRLASALRVHPETFLAPAGRVPEDVLKILLADPGYWTMLRTAKALGLNSGNLSDALSRNGSRVSAEGYDINAGRAGGDPRR
jgi:transcriptional regulator with XRE-family HTH domain